MDSRLKSLSENALNLAVGFSINYVANTIILPQYCQDVLENELVSYLMIGFWFTIVSIIRQYFFRRLFERFGERENLYTLTIRLLNKIRHNTS